MEVCSLHLVAKPPVSFLLFVPGVFLEGVTQACLPSVLKWLLGASQYSNSVTVIVSENATQNK